MDREVLKKRLLEQQAEFTRRLEELEHHREHRPVSKQFDEQVVDTNDDEVVANLRAEAREALSQVEAALARNDSPQFDHCSECGETISDERLEAIPYTQKCRNCAV